MLHNNMTTLQGKLQLPLFVVDAFTKHPFNGNAAAVCLVTTKDDVSDVVKQKLATELNFSETAFVTRTKDNDNFETGNKFGLRWFTPTNEVPLCGHATLASAAVLFNAIGNKSQTLHFNTLSGELLATKNGNLISLDMPLNEPEKIDDESLNDLIKIACGPLAFEETQYSPTTKKLMIRLKDQVTRAELEQLTPPAQLMMHSHNTGMVKGVIITLKGSKENGSVNDSGEQYDFLSRYFAPWYGVNEDPVTGSAHTVLGGYWSRVLQKKSLFARQCSKQGGELHLLVKSNGRIGVSGDARILISGHFYP